MRIREVQSEDFHEWLRMRHALWPKRTLKELFSEMVLIFKDRRLANELDWIVLVMEKENGLCGFIEASLHPHEANCATAPVGFIEGWWMDPDYRQHGYGGMLVEEAENWALAKGCCEMASYTDDEREMGLISYQALGYRVTSRGENLTFTKNIR